MSESDASGRAIGNPAEAGRFRAGRSGNPGGRPKTGAVADSAFAVLAERTLTVKQGGVRRALKIAEALQLKTYQAAIAGNRPARTAILKMIARREQAIAARGPAPVPIRREIERVDPRNADAALLILGIAEIKDGIGWGEGVQRLRLAQWAIDAAADRGFGASDRA